MFDLTTIGEGQIRLTVAQGERLSRCNTLRVSAACSEANVSGLLAQLGHRTSWCSRVPRGDLAERCLSEFRSVGVDMSAMLRTDEGRMALYFMEPGQPPMPSRVSYDRTHSPFRTITPEMVDWDVLLSTRLVFVTGITAALTDQTYETLRHFVSLAHDSGIDVALDVNYRSLLWSPTQARRRLGWIAERSSIIFCSRTDARVVFDINAPGAEASLALREMFGATHVVSTDSTDGVYYAGPDGEQDFEVRTVPIVDRPGAGDAFVAGTLHGFLSGDIVGGIGHGLHVSKFALTHHGDLTHVTAEELGADPQSTDILR
ncbi:sugar kinase [Phycicoccus flavus]|uniref:sugar kinase n=1 Tax=Phycicoccus flavus TaxID=2502783 RepID=UPI000FEB670F|nr:sugar kinase [Phycicoccus flavus]NHA68603.1 sugar kinase [Phycicoccus flavus]NHA68698.1 sugar kinase [Phycicoccus flavus]